METVPPWWGQELNNGMEVWGGISDACAMLCTLFLGATWVTPWVTLHHTIVVYHIICSIYNTRDK